MIVEYEDFIKGNWRIQQRNTMTEELYALLKKHECAGDFTHVNVTDGMLNGAEKRMNIKIPENCGEWLYCLNSDNGSVVMCSGRSANYTEAFGDFETYLYDRVNDMLENM